MEHIESHSEAEIVKGCISLMRELTGLFEAYLDSLSVEPESSEERFVAKFSYFEIVQRLLLWETHHSGGTSTIRKCDELGFHYNNYVVFADERDKEEDK